MKRTGIITPLLLASLFAGLTLASAAAVQGEWSHFGTAETVRAGGRDGNQGALRLHSTLLEEPFTVSFGGVTYIPGSPMTFADIDHLSTEYRGEEGTFGGGTPRFQIALDTTGDGEFNGNVFVYLGTPSNFTDAMSGEWEGTGNLTDDGEPRFDLTQLGGPFFGTHADALDLVGDADVLAVRLVVDGGWFPFGDAEDQTILVRDIRVNDDRHRAIGPPR